ncbi:MAG: DUF5667 domain-containing protein, partial [Nitrosarchaeum sp.]|nr:DUF5667 domain-containing protein [Nitrosarchaeum sp.]
MSDIFEKFEKLKKIDIADPIWIKSNREKLLSHISFNSQIFVKQPIAQKTGFTFNSLVKGLLHPAPATFALAFLIVFGLAAQAGSALPGDALYGVKLVNESVKSALTVSNQGKIDYEIELVGKRFQEVAELSLAQVPDIEKIVVAQESAHKQLETTQDKVIKLEDSQTSKDALDTTVKLISTVETQKKIIDTLGE